MAGPLDSSRYWYELPAVAEAAPLAFLQHGWGWLVTTCEKHHSGASSTVLNYYGGHGSALDDDDDDDPRPTPSVLQSFLSAIDMVAKSHPIDFVNITRDSWVSENAVVHRLIIRGMCIVAQTHPKVALEYLTGDARRFQVGSYIHHQQSESAKLIAAMAPHLTRNDLDRLEQAILHWSSYRPDVSLIDDQVVWNREARLRLLDSIGVERLSSDALAFLQKEKTELKNWDSPRSGRPRAGFVRQLSPISKEELKASTNEDILKIIQENPTEDRSKREWKEVEGGWEEPGGAVAAGDEIAQLMKDDTPRGLEIISYLVTHGSEEAATQAVNGLAETGLSDEEILQFIRSLVRLNPKSEGLRSNIGDALNRRCRPKIGLPDDICDTLRSWLSQPWAASDDSESTLTTIDEHDKNKEVQSVLWSDGHPITLGRAYFPLIALSHGYLMRTPPACDKWLDAVDQLLTLPFPVRTWSAYCAELRWIRLKGCDSVRGAKTIATLFKKFPTLGHTSEGIKLVAYVADLLSEPFLKGFLDSLNNSQGFSSRQAYGELIALIAFRGQHDPWATQRLNNELKSIRGDAPFDEAIAVGLGFAAAHLWDEPKARTRASQVLCHLFPLATDSVAHAIETMFWTDQPLSIEPETEAFLRTCAENPQSLSRIQVARLVEHLVPLVAHKRQLTLDLCKSIVKAKKPDNDLFEAGPDLVKIAMTLQRYPDTRTEGLTLLEDLLQIGLDDAFRVLSDIDIRPRTVREYTPLRVRRRRRSR